MLLGDVWVHGHTLGTCKVSPAVAKCLAPGCLSQIWPCGSPLLPDRGQEEHLSDFLHWEFLWPQKASLAVQDGGLTEAKCKL